VEVAATGIYGEKGCKGPTLAVEEKNEQACDTDDGGGEGEHRWSWGSNRTRFDHWARYVGGWGSTAAAAAALVCSAYSRLPSRVIGGEKEVEDACDNPPRKIPSYRLKPIHFGH
jgi:hypothetical protein